MNLWGSVFTHRRHHNAPFLTARARRAPVCLCWRSASERHVVVAVVNHLGGQNTHPVHGLRGRMVNYRIGFDLDEEARTAITVLLATVWEPALDTAGSSATKPTSRCWTAAPFPHLLLCMRTAGRRRAHDSVLGKRSFADARW